MYQSTNPETNKILHAMGEMNFSGNVTPMEWYRTIRHNGKPDTTAIILLSDIVYWYRPAIVRDESTGLPIEYQKKFKADLLQKSYKEYGDLFGFSAKQIREAFIRLEKIGVLQRVFRTIETPVVGRLCNVLFIKLYPQTLHALTFPSSSEVNTPFPPGKHPLPSRETPPTLQGKTYTETTTATTTVEEHSAPSPTQEVLSEPDKKKQKKGTRLGEDWVLPPEWRLWATEHGMTRDHVDVNEMKFKNYWLSTNKNPVKVDWYRTWQNWCISELERKGVVIKDKSISGRPVSVPHQSLEVKQSADPKVQQWNELQGQLRDDVGLTDYNSWLADLELVEIGVEKAVLKTNSNFRAQWVNRNYMASLWAVLRKIEPRLLEMNVEVVA